MGRDAPPAVLAALGVRFDPLQGRFRPSGEATIGRVLESVGAAELDAAITGCLASLAGVTGRRAVAVDGKALRGTRHRAGDGQAAHLLAAIDQQARTVLAQRSVDGKTNEITQFAPLLDPLDLAGSVITADALQTQRDHADYLVTGKKADYILVVKGNQPGLDCPLRKLPWNTVPAAARHRDRGRHRLRRARLPARRAGPTRHPADAAAGRREMADRHRLRDRQPGLRPGHAIPPRQLDPRALADRGRAPHPRRHLCRRRLPGAHP